MYWIVDSSTSALLDPLRRELEHLAEIGVQLLLVGLLLGDAVRRQLDRQADAVLDQHTAVAIHDLPARRLHLDVAHPVRVRLGAVLLAGEDL
jgi:hypothetical protein